MLNPWNLGRLDFKMHFPVQKRKQNIWTLPGQVCNLISSLVRTSARDSKLVPRAEQWKCWKILITQYLPGLQGGKQPKQLLLKKKLSKLDWVVTAKATLFFLGPTCENGTENSHASFAGIFLQYFALENYRGGAIVGRISQSAFKGRHYRLLKTIESSTLYICIHAIKFRNLWTQQCI